MQITVPVLHGTHAGTLANHDHASTASAGVLAPAHGSHGEGSHDRADCPQCRIVSQLKTLSSPAMVLGAPLLSAHWIARSRLDRPLLRETRDSAPPRGPPSLA